MLRRPAPGPRRTDPHRRQLPAVAAHLAMPLRKLRRALPLLAFFLLACALGAAVAGATAMVETREVRIKVNAAFQPRNLPVKSFAPVRFSGSLEVSKPGGGQPPALDQIVLDFDRDGRLDVA